MGNIDFAGQVGQSCTMSFDGYTVSGWSMAFPPEAAGYMARLDASNNATTALVLTMPNEQSGMATVHDVNSAGQFAVTTFAGTPQGKPPFVRLISESELGWETWEKTFGGFGTMTTVTPLGASIDAAQDVLFECYVNPWPWDFGGGSVPAGTYLVKYGPMGQYLWAQSFPYGYAPTVARFEATPQGDIFAYANGANFGCGPAGAHMARLDPSGSCVWAKQFTGAVPSLSHAVDASGNSLLAGPFNGTIDLGCGPLSSPNGTSLAVAKINASGSCVFSKAFTGPSFSMQAGFDPVSMAATSAGDWLMAFGYTGSIDLGGGPVASADPSGAILAKLDASGGFRWDHYAPHFLSGSSLTLIAADPPGGMIVASSNPQVDLGQGPLQNGNPGIVFARFAP